MTFKKFRKRCSFRCKRTLLQHHKNIKLVLERPSKNIVTYKVSHLKYLSWCHFIKICRSEVFLYQKWTSSSIIYNHQNFKNVVQIILEISASKNLIGQPIQTKNVSIKYRGILQHYQFKIIYPTISFKIIPWGFNLD